MLKSESFRDQNYFFCMSRVTVYSYTKDPSANLWILVDGLLIVFICI